LVERIAANEPNPLRRRIAQREARALARYEAAMGRVYDAMLTVTQEDQARLLGLYPPGERAIMQKKLATVPICVDPDQTPVVPHQPASHPTILHLGTMFWPPNISGVLWFAKEVLPLIWQQAPVARFVIVGKNPPPEVVALSADPRIAVTGYVADPTPFLAAADVFIVPLHAGGGMRVKILDAWLWGLPVVSTAIGAEGIALLDGENILIATDAASFAEATLRTLRDPSLNHKLRTAGRAWVSATYGWRSVYQAVDAVYARLLATRTASQARGST
jgi:glycosyltransferase involved in cell wall biosynthesis